jgi:uncharacterized protein YndB with AHSA1/START domain
MERPPPFCSVELRRVVPAAPEVVFATVTEPELATRWMEGEVESDLRIGGIFSSRGSGLFGAGEFLEIDPPSTLIFSWKEFGSSTSLTLVSMRFESLAEVTEVRIRHLVHSEFERSRYRAVWGTWLDRLESGVAAYAR